MTFVETLLFRGVAIARLKDACDDHVNAFTLRAHRPKWPSVATMSRATVHERLARRRFLDHETRLGTSAGHETNERAVDRMHWMGKVPFSGLDV